MRDDTVARAHTCPRCGALTLRALDDEVAGLLAVVDPLPLDGPAAELAAILDGRTTYDLIGVYRKRLAMRDELRIAAGSRYPVLATHRCPGPVPGDALDHALTATTDGDDTPPF